MWFIIIALVLYISLVVIVKSGILDARLQGSRKLEPTEIRRRAIVLTVIATVMIMGISIGLDQIIYNFGVLL